MTRARPALFVAASLLVAAVACSGGTHPYSARGFDASRGCLLPTTGVDVIEGADNGLGCARKCLVGPPRSDGNGRAVYISTACPPYPPGYDTSGAPPECVDAVSAAEREDVCLADGGSTKPAPRDAGTTD